MSAGVPIAGVMPHPGERRLVSGLRWTLWLSLLTAPCGYATGILLARISPQAIGEYGLLSLYVAMTSVFLFLGGPAVAIRFIPGLSPEDRLPFFCSYLVIACFAALPFQLAACLWPGALHYIFGEVGTPQFHIALIWLADFYILFNLAVAGLKAVMELKVAQLLQRGVTVVSFAVYALLYIFLRDFTATHHHALIWSVYFGATGLATFGALRCLLAFSRKPIASWFGKLPAGFWRYTVGLQASSALGFFSTRLDYVFILNAGGLAVLGRYVALMTLVSVIPMFATFVLDSYLPSLTSLLASGDSGAAERLTRTYVRLIILFGAGAISFMNVFGVFLLHMLGPDYADLMQALLLALPFAGIQIGNWILGTVFSGIGEPQRDAIAKTLRTVIFIAVFWPLWNSTGFLGAVWAWGIAEASYQLAALLMLRRVAAFRLHLGGAYIPLLLLALTLWSVHTTIATATLPASIALWLAAMAAFLLSARYGFDEIATFWHALIPCGRTAEADAFTAGVNRSILA